MSHPRLRLVIAEDQALLRVGLTRILEAGGFTVATAVDTEAALEAALNDPSIDAAVVDVRLPPSYTNEGLRAAIAARHRRPRFPVVVLSQFVEPLYASELLASGEGAIAYLLKDRVADVEGFIGTVRMVIDGGTALDPEVVAGLVRGAHRQQPLERLTVREREVLALIAQGRSNAAIATRLVVTEKAVGKHINNIFMKFDLPQAPDDNRRVLAVLAWLQGRLE